MVPFTSEQRANAKRVAELGCGMLVKKQSPQSIRRQIEELLFAKSYKENALKMQEDFQMHNGAKSAADFIERIL
jgi:UDP:flavonoid glycosyltransferase YjiC (YdhE family)